ncbi:Uncharacterized protein APZ42_033204 [Daphnia magna]|uniref:Reverse transcriptase domain-containing protein n=1 Tax=Daphnia magna TaxID=35525 RepID=A0A164LAZ5_9CRUS|nr:Uncharacterized protein APZ42_033204 [Daphnia magna]
MDESDGGAPSDPPGSDRRCKHCNKTFQIVHNGHRCCTPECMKAQQALRRLSSSTSTATKTSNTWKKDTTQSPDKVDSNDTKNLCSALSLLENQLLVISELELAISRLSDDNVSVLESKVASLSSDLEIQEDQVKCLKDEAVQMKIFFEIDHGDFDKPNKKSYRPSVPTLPRINRDLYSIELAKALGRLPIPIHIESSEAVEAQVANLTSVLSASAFAARDPVSRLKCSKNMMWWTKNLCAPRSRTRSFYKAWSKHRNAQSEQLYRSNFKGKSKSIPLPSEILIDGAPSTDPMAIADGYVRHFFPDEPPSNTAHSAVENEALASIHAHHDGVPLVISDWEFESAVRSFNPKSAPGRDGISADLLLFSLPLIKPYLSVAVIGKPNKGDYSSLNSYRTISFVSNLARILEKVVLRRLVCLTNAGDWTNTNQHSFRENMSTETATHYLISFIEGAFSDKKVQYLYRAENSKKIPVLKFVVYEYSFITFTEMDSTESYLFL